MNKREQVKFDKHYTKYLRLLKLQGYSKATIDCYSRAIRRLSSWCGKCPDQRLKKVDFENYFTELLKTHSWSTVKCDRNGIMRYWKLVLAEEWQHVDLVKPPKSKHYPDILTASELNNTFSCVNKCHYRVFLYTVYTLGIRLSEGLYLQLGDVDGEKMLVHIHDGKGCKDRFVILPDNTYKVLRRFWQTHRSTKWLFPSLQSARLNSPMDRGSTQVAMKRSVKQANIHKRISIHNLRHSYATHCLEHGMDLCSLQELLGHDDPKTTAMYTQLTERIQKNNRVIINEFVNQVVMPSMGSDNDEN